MSIDPAELDAELASLRKGRGARTRDLTIRVGPQIRELLKIGDLDTPTHIRTRLAELIDTCLGETPDLRLAALAAFGLHPDASHRFLEGRTAWLARQLVCDERTARRRIAQTQQLIVEKAAGAPLFAEPNTSAARPPDADDGWYVCEFRVALRVDADGPEAIEHRIIEFTENSVEELIYRFSLPKVPGAEPTDHSLQAEALYGVRIVGCERPVPEHFRFRLKLPKAFQSGERHEFGFSTKVPPGQAMQPYYVYTPYRRCEAFDLTVRFDPEDLPDAVWRLEEAVPLVISSSQAMSPLLKADALGEVRVSFRGLKQGLGYGIRWSKMST